MGFTIKNLKEAYSEATLSNLRGQAFQRIEEVQKKLDGPLTTAFDQAAQHEGSNDMGFMGALALDFVLCGLFSALSGSAFHSLLTAAACMEGLAMLADQNADSYRNRKIDGYPEGRRKYAINTAKMSRKFNLISANQNGSFSRNMAADMACMFEIIDMIDKLEREGVQAMNLDTTQSVYAVLKQTTKQLRRKEIISSHSAPVLKAV